MLSTILGGLPSDFSHSMRVYRRRYLGRNTREFPGSLAVAESRLSTGGRGFRRLAQSGIRDGSDSAPIWRGAFHSRDDWFAAKTDHSNNFLRSWQALRRATPARLPAGPHYLDRPDVVPAVRLPALDRQPDGRLARRR